MQKSLQTDDNHVTKKQYSNSMKFNKNHLKKTRV